MSEAQPRASRGRVWFEKLAMRPSACPTPSVLSAAGMLGADITQFVAVVPDEHNRFSRARHGEVGIDEAWALAGQVLAAVDADRTQAKRAIVAIVDSVHLDARGTFNKH